MFSSGGMCGRDARCLLANMYRNTWSILASTQRSSSGAMDRSHPIVGQGSSVKILAGCAAGAKCWPASRANAFPKALGYDLG